MLISLMRVQILLLVPVNYSYAYVFTVVSSESGAFTRDISIYVTFSATNGIDHEKMSIKFGSMYG